MRTIEEFAKSGEHHDVMDALSLLTHAYISQCGISLGDRSVIYVAAERWLERLAWMDLPLSEMARKYPLVCVMPHITSEYDPELYDEYDICGMDKKELLSVCRQILMDELFDEATNEVLCWGIIKATEERKKLSQEIETTAKDGTCLKGILTDQQLGCTYLTMTSPFEGIHISKCELVRDARELLITGYEDYQRLHYMERDISNKSLNESSVNRMLQWLKDCDCAFISVFRSELKDIRDVNSTYLGLDNNWEAGKQLTHEENRKKNKLMVAELLQLGYGVTKVKGVYPEGMTDESTEESYLVVNRNNDKNFLNNLLRISEYYNQDSIDYKEKGKTMRALRSETARENRKSKMMEAIDFWRNMIDGKIIMKEDIHPLTRKTMGEELRKMRKLQTIK